MYYIEINGKSVFTERFIMSLKNKIYKHEIPIVKGIYSVNSYLCFPQILPCSVSYLFFLYWWPSLSLYTVFDAISFNMDEVLSISPSANMFVSRDFNIHHQDWLIYSGGTDRPSKLFYDFSNNIIFL